MSSHAVFRSPRVRALKCLAVRGFRNLQDRAFRTLPIRAKKAVAAVVLVGVAVATPAFAAEGGGVGAPHTPDATRTPTAELHPDQSNGIVLKVKPAVAVDSSITVRGSVQTLPKTVALQIKKRRLGWVVVDRATVDSKLRFRLRYRPRKTGRLHLRVAAESNAESSDAAVAPTAKATVAVVRTALATWFGPGFYGTRTACGRTLTRRTQGVAHLRLPCGRKVLLHYRGRTVIVPVIDRGPYGGSAKWDLTTATAKRIGMNSTARIGALPLPRRK